MFNNSDAKSLSSSSYSYSFSLPRPPVAEIQSVVIGCCEDSVLPKPPELERLWPSAYLTVPGGVIAGVPSQVPQQPLYFLESLLASAKQVEHVIICLHTGCNYLTKDTDLCGNVERCIDILPSQIEESHLDPLQAILKGQLELLQEMIDRSLHLSSRKLALHGWLYEPELDWLSYLDTELGLFLPLSAHEELCC